MKKIRFILLIICCFIIGGCGNNAEPEEESTEILFLEKYSIKQMDDGWVYYMVISYPDKDKKEINTAYLGAVNTKYKVLKEDAGIAIIDEEGSEVDRIKGVMPDLSRIDTYKDELARIHEFLTEHQFNEEIELSDLNSLETSSFSKDLIVEMYNDALNSNHDFGKYGYLSNDCKQILDSENNTLQISYTINYGRISSFNIEYIYSDGTYLSEIAVSSNDSKLYDLQEKIDAYENEILTSQDYKTEHSFTEIKGLDDTVEKLMKSIFERVEDQ